MNLETHIEDFILETGKRTNIVEYQESYGSMSIKNISATEPNSTITYHLDDRDGFYYYEDIESLKHAWVKEPHFIPLVVVYGTVFLFGILGNAMVIFSVFGGRTGRSVTFSFMVSLAMADILFLLVVVPHETLRMVLGEWSGGRSFCKISGFIEMLTAVASILNLTAVSFERYFVIVMPMQSRRKCTLGNTRRILVAVWVAAILLSAPSFYIKDTESTTYYNNDSSVSMMFCSDHGLEDDQRIHFAIYQLLVMFIMPTILMIYSYTVVIYVLWISGRTLINMTSTYRLRNINVRQIDKSSTTIYSTSMAYRRRNFISESVPSSKDVRHSVIRGRKQVIRMLITVVLVFLFSWGPKLVFQIFKYSKFESSMHTHIHFKLQIVIYCLPYVQSCLNPVIYCVMSKSFRKSVRTSCNVHVHGLPCNGRRSPIMEIEMESKFNGATVHTKARGSRSTSE